MYNKIQRNTCLLGTGKGACVNVAVNGGKNPDGTRNYFGNVADCTNVVDMSASPPGTLRTNTMPCPAGGGGTAAPAVRPVASKKQQTSPTPALKPKPKPVVTQPARVVWVCPPGKVWGWALSKGKCCNANNRGCVGAIPKRIG